MENKNEVMSGELFLQAKDAIATDMRARGIGAIMWDCESDRFAYLPRVAVFAPGSFERVAEIGGIYRRGNSLFLMERGRAPVSVDDYYDKDAEKRPLVVTLTEEQACAQLGEPGDHRGLTECGSVEDWLTVADCYFEALVINNDI